MTESSAPSQQTIDDVLIIGAGPAGLTAAYQLTKKSRLKIRVLEAHPTHVGGIARTESHKGFLFDIGGHRFFSKSQEIEELWREIMPQDFLLRPRISRIYYQHKFYSYPLRAWQALCNLGLIESTLCMISYVEARLRPIKPARSFSDWVTNKFGARLFRIFFKTYTEKIWGMNCDEISADWAAQRIKGLNLSRAVWAGLRKSLGQKPAGRDGKIIKTLIDNFHYPRRGPGMMWETAAAKIRAKGGTIEMGLKAVSFTWDNAQNLWLVTAESKDGARRQFRAKQVISSAPLRDAVTAITPVPETARQARNLKYRDFLTVAVMLDRPAGFNDNWIYVHDAGVRVGRIQNFAAWSPDMVPDTNKSCLGLEYFCFEGDGLWSMEDHDLIELAKSELEQLGLARREHIVDGCVVRQPKAYPVYDDAYRDIIASVREEFARRYPTFHLVGRNGMHKYDNQDHAMMTALLTVENILGHRPKYDIWSVNEDAEYHEEKATYGEARGGLRDTPERKRT